VINKINLRTGNIMRLIHIDLALIEIYPKSGWYGVSYKKKRAHFDFAGEN
jgi:hypothetical protein